MNNPLFSGPDAARSELRAAFADVEKEMALLPAPADGKGEAGGSTGLRASFQALVKLMALGPDPELRACPKCQQMGMLEATTCGFCWTKLTPPEKGAVAVA